jgi:hypothetical protein
MAKSGVCLYSPLQTRGFPPHNTPRLVSTGNIYGAFASLKRGLGERKLAVVVLF